MKGPALTPSGHDATRLRAVSGSGNFGKALNDSSMPVPNLSLALIEIRGGRPGPEAGPEARDEKGRRLVEFCISTAIWVWIWIWIWSRSREAGDPDAAWGKSSTKITTLCDEDFWLIVCTSKAMCSNCKCESSSLNDAAQGSLGLCQLSVKIPHAYEYGHSLRKHPWLSYLCMAFGGRLKRRQEKNC